jgi:D-tyrosyl-tRNA(Tyr) deacylase
MRAVIQRVNSASVTINGKIISQIGTGICLLVGFNATDNASDMDYIINKTLNLRIFEDDNDKMNFSLKDIHGELLVVSQFTLYGDCRKGRRPSFSQSGDVESAKQKYLEFKDKIQSAFDQQVAFGQFQADMLVHIDNDGPVTMLLDSSKLF